MLLGVDIETTGTLLKRDAILELGMALITDELEIVAEASWVTRFEARQMKAPIAPFVIEMHTANGLWAECAEALLSVADVELMALNFLVNQGVARGEVPMFGSSIHFDRAFLAEHMPRLESFFHYRNVDVSTIRELCKRWRPELIYDAPKEHRVLGDIRRSTSLLRHFKQALWTP